MTKKRLSLTNVCTAAHAFDTTAALAFAFGSAVRDNATFRSASLKRVPGLTTFTPARNRSRGLLASRSSGHDRKYHTGSLKRGGSKAATYDCGRFTPRHGCAAVQRRYVSDSGDGIGGSQDEQASSGRYEQLFELVGSKKKRKPADKDGVTAQDVGEDESAQSSLSVQQWQSRFKTLARAAYEMAAAQKSKPSAPVSEDAKLLLNYTGEAIPVEKRKSSVPPPWKLSTDERETTTSTNALNEEIARFVKHIGHDKAERNARDVVIKRTRKFIELRAPEAGLRLHTYVFGSEKTGLSLCFSDIDIGVAESTEHLNFLHDVQSLKPMMQRLHALLESSLEYTKVEIRMGMFPIIECRHKKTGLEIQIVTRYTSSPQKRSADAVLAELPHLRSLYTVFRTALDMRGLHDVFTGGIGSYGLLMMLAASLVRRGTVLPSSPAGQLLHILDFYSEFDTTRYGISVPGRKLFLKHPLDEPPNRYATRDRYDKLAHKREDTIRAGQWRMGCVNAAQPYLLCLQEPASHNNDLGRKTHTIKHILATFKDMRDRLRANMKLWDSGSAHRSESLLLPIVGPCHEVYAQRRSLVSRFGAGELAYRKEMKAAKREGYAKVGGDAGVR